MTDIELIENGILTNNYHALLNSSRKYNNTVSSCPIVIDKYYACFGNKMICGTTHEVINEIKDIADSAQYYRDKDGRKRQAHIYYICICDDIKILYANIKNDSIIRPFLKTETEPVYIDLGDNVRVVEYKGTASAYHKMCKSAGVLVYSKTGVVRQRLKDNWLNQTTWTHERIRSLYPDEVLYRAVIRWLYRGGKVFCEAKSDIIYNDVHAADITSAHVWHMLVDDYPTTAFTKVDGSIALDAINNHMSAILDVTFKNVKPKMMMGWENKYIDLKNPIWDGKGILHADEMRVMITEVDLKIYKIMYMWDDISINAAWIAHSNPLPAYLRTTIKQTVRHKQKLKHSGVTGNEYIEAKGDVNMLYGLTAQKLNMTICNKEGQGVGQEYNKIISNKILSPFWGIWTAAYTRLQQAELIRDLTCNGLHSIYGDTDSVYCVGNKDYFKTVVKEHNYKVKRINENKKLQGELADLGMWTVEEYNKFKSLGCKRYMYETDGKLIYKCSGILKDAMQGVTFDMFKNDTEISNARRILSRDETNGACYKYESVTLGKCAADAELSHWYLREILKL